MLIRSFAGLQRRAALKGTMYERLASKSPGPRDVPIDPVRRDAIPFLLDSLAEHGPTARDLLMNRMCQFRVGIPEKALMLARAGGMVSASDARPVRITKRGRDFLTLYRARQRGLVC